MAEYGSPSYHTETPNLQRTARYTLSVIAPPSTLGFQRVSKDFKSKLQLKIVPSTATVTALASRIETLAGPLLNLTGATWAASWGPNDVPNFFVNLYKSFLKRYSGATIGVRSIIAGGGVADSEQIEKCFVVASYNTIRLPEYVQKLIGAHTPFVDKDGILIPFVSSLSTPVTNLVYTGSNFYTTPPTSAQFGTGVLNQLDNRIYKQFESSMVARENMMLYGQFGRTMMDFTFLRDSSASAVLGVVSRREQTPALMSSALSLINVITYDSNNITSTNQGNHSFRQHSRRLFSGSDTVATYVDINRYDGIVVGGLTSNMSDANGPDNSVNDRSAPIYNSGGSGNSVSRGGGAPLHPPTLYEVPYKSDVPLLTKWASRIIPRAGKYCGPGWTAGVDTGDTTPAVSDKGEHMVKPTDDEDAICKAHDEAYGRAGDDRKKIAAADWEMVKKLRDLRREKGLSIYGLAAELAIATKASITNLSPTSVAEYFGINQ